MPTPGNLTELNRQYQIALEYQRIMFENMDPDEELMEIDAELECLWGQLYKEINRNVGSSSS